MDWKSLFAEHPIIGQALAGAAGGVVRWIWGAKEIGFWAGLGTVFGGMLCAMYLTDYVPLVVNAIVQKTLGAEVGLPPDIGDGGAFLTGILGMMVVGFLIDLFSRAKREGSRD